MAHCALVLAVSLGTLLGATAASSDTSDQSLALTARAFSFIRDRHVANVRVALVRDPSNSDSVEEATRMRSAISNGAVIANMRMTLIDVRLDEADATGNVDVIWFTKGLKNSYERLAQIANRQHALSVSSDLDCAQDGLCVLGIQAEPSVRIILSSNAAARAGIAFQPAFRMMVTER